MAFKQPYLALYIFLWPVCGWVCDVCVCLFMLCTAEVRNKEMVVLCNKSFPRTLSFFFVLFFLDNMKHAWITGVVRSWNVMFSAVSKQWYNINGRSVVGWWTLNLVNFAEAVPGASLSLAYITKVHHWFTSLPVSSCCSSQEIPLREELENIVVGEGNVERTCTTHLTGEARD